MTMSNNSKFALVFAILALLYLLQNLINIKRYRRGRQVAQSFVAGGYFILALFVFTAKRPAIWEKLSEWIYTLTDDVGAVVSGEIFLMNALLVFVYLVIKLPLRFMFTKIWASKSLMETTAGRYYEYDEGYDEWFLRLRYVNLRKLANVLGFSSLILTALLLSVTWVNGPESKEWLFYFPAAALLVINEIRAFLNGQTKEEYEESVLGDEADSRKIGNFYRIREIYEKLFAGELLASHTGTEFMSHKAATDLLEKMEKSEDKIDRMVSQYFLTLDNLIKLEPDSVAASSQLMHGENALFFNPFYKDLSVYLTLPLVNCVLRGKKCLVMAGTDAACSDITAWISDLIRDYSRIREMWRVGLVSNKPADFEIGVLAFRQLYDIDVLAENRDFLAEVEFVLILGPSSMLSTGQIGFSILVREICRYGEAPVYCICDRYSDGLVDTMSHVLQAEITNVVAAPVPRCVYTGMAWNADGDYIRQKLFDKQTKFLGNGMELAAVAIKNQIPQVTWYGETKAPLRDIKWIVGQHYSTLCRYMHIPTQQSSIYEKISFIPSLWTRPTQREQFIIVEDEFCNMFTMIRTYVTRGIDQAFVNILSENYLLRDYMRCNQQMFMSNPNAIPSLLPDYAKSVRNTLIKLIILMTVRKVPEAEVEAEMRLAGCKFNDTLAMFSSILQKHTFVDSNVLDIKTAGDESETGAGLKTTLYSISPTKFRKHFASTIRNAYYIVEDEKSEKEYIDVKMFGHISQTIMPGQFVTYDGKYYEVKLITPESGVILRRASELYTGRKYYRQIRHYHFDEDVEPVVLEAKTITDIQFIVAETDFHVNTSGYLEMDDNHDLRGARLVDLTEDPNIGCLDRKYHNKAFLKIKLPETDTKIRFTISLLLSELFRSVFPDTWHYLAVLTHRPEDISGILNELLYAVDGNIDEEGIYIVEDSDIDLGLLDAVRRNFPLILEIITDFLDWHFEKMREPEHLDPMPIEIKLPEEEKRRNLFLRMADKIRQLFGIKPKTEDEVEIDYSVEEVENLRPEEPVPKTDEREVSQVPEGDYELGGAEDAAEEISVLSQLPEEDLGGGDYELRSDSEEEERAEVQDQTLEGDLLETEEERRAKALAYYPEDELEPNSDADLTYIDGTDIFEDDGLPEDNDWLEEQFIAAGITPIRKTRYQKECFLKFGFEDVDSRLHLEDVQKYFHARGYSNNNLTKARKRDIMEKSLLDFNVEQHCDFCQVPLSGVSFEQLNDGRIRCNDCSSSAITLVSEFRTIYYRVRELMEMFYSIRYHIPITVKMTDARTIARHERDLFGGSTPGGRTLGFAMRRYGKFSIMMENGSPRLVTIETIVHELTHVWQYINWKKNEVDKIYEMPSGSCKRKAVGIVFEGMAVWASIQYLYQIGETYFASQQEEIEKSKDDIYGIGFRLYCDRYPLVKDMSLIKYSPFTSYPPLDPADVRRAVKNSCKEKNCLC